MKKIIALASFLIMGGLIILASCKKDELNNNRTNPPVTSNDSTLKLSPFPWGAALNINTLKNNAKYASTVVKEMQSVTAENAMKMGALSTGRGQYKWEDADDLVNFAQTYNLRIHGHALVWYKQSGTSMPAWVIHFSGTKEEWKQIMKEHITAVVTRYKGKVTSWDVVNEAIKDDGTFRPASECIWTKNIGVPEYIDWAFQCAHEADPDALLFYNDFGHEYSSAKRTGVNNLVAGMKQRGVPIHGIGMQMHTGIHRNVNDIRTAITTAASTGLLVHISELDIKVNNELAQGITFTEDLAQKQSYHYQMVSKFMKDIPEKQCFGITMWGVHDSSSWLHSNPDWPLLFDNDFERKPAYYGAVKGFQ